MNSTKSTAIRPTIKNKTKKIEKKLSSEIVNENSQMVPNVIKWLICVNVFAAGCFRVLFVVFFFFRVCVRVCVENWLIYVLIALIENR